MGLKRQSQQVSLKNDPLTQHKVINFYVLL